MNTTILCPSCSKAYSLPEKLDGKRVRCVGCRTEFVAQFASMAAPTAAPVDARANPDNIRSPGARVRVPAGPARSSPNPKPPARKGMGVGLLLLLILGPLAGFVVLSGVLILAILWMQPVRHSDGAHDVVFRPPPRDRERLPGEDFPNGPPRNDPPAIEPPQNDPPGIQPPGQEPPTKQPPAKQPPKAAPLPPVVRPEIKPAPLNADAETRALPSTLGDVAVGGGGRYLVFTLPKNRQVGIFDANEAKVVKYVSVGGEDARVAAGVDTFVVGLPGAGVLQRWSLKTFEKELTVASPLSETLGSVWMGASSQGPLLVCAQLNRDRGARGLLLDLRTMKQIDLRGKTPGGAPELIRVSGDGTLFGFRDSVGGEPHTMSLMTFRDGDAKVQESWGFQSSLLIPDDGGRYVYATGGVYTTELKKLYPTTKDQPSGSFVPARQGPYFLRLEPAGGDRFGRGDPDGRGSVTIHLEGSYDKLTTVTGLEGIYHEAISYGSSRDSLNHDRRVHFIADAKLLVTIPATNDKLLLRRVDIDKELEKADFDYLLVTSRPPLSVKPGADYSYLLTVKSKRGGVKFKLESGPKGMALDATGKLTWKAAGEAAGAEHDIIISVSDASKQEVYHTFKLVVTE